MTKLLQETHFIVASASSYAPLLKAGIKVDFLVILERGYDVYDAYKAIHDEYGSNDTIVVRSSVSDCRFKDLTGKDVVFFRASLTPFGVFSPSPDSILPYESPQAINAGVSFASTFVPESIIFAGIDLGAMATGDARADGAWELLTETLLLKGQEIYPIWFIPSKL